MIVRRAWIVSLLLALALIGTLAPRPSAAQGPDRLTETYIAENGTFSIQYPFGWGARAQFSGSSATRVTFTFTDPYRVVGLGLLIRSTNGPLPPADGDVATQVADLVAQQSALPVARDYCMADGSGRTDTYSDITTVTLGGYEFAVVDYRCTDNLATVGYRYYVAFVNDYYALYANIALYDEMTTSDLETTAATVTAMIETIQFNDLILNAAPSRFDPDDESTPAEPEPLYGATSEVIFANRGQINFTYPTGWTSEYGNDGESVRLSYRFDNSSDDLQLIASTSRAWRTNTTIFPPSERPFLNPQPYRGLDHDAFFAEVWDQYQAWIDPATQITPLSAPITRQLGNNTYTEVVWYQSLPLFEGRTLPDGFDPTAFATFGVLTLPSGEHWIADGYNPGLSLDERDRFDLILSQRYSALATFSLEPYPPVTPTQYAPITPDNWSQLSYLTALPNTTTASRIEFWQYTRLLLFVGRSVQVYDWTTGESYDVGGGADDLYFIRGDAARGDAVSADSILLVNQYESSFNVQLWDIASNTLTYSRTFSTERADEQQAGSVQSALSADGTTLAITVFAAPYTIQLIDVATGDRIGRLESGFDSDNLSNYVLMGDNLFACLHNPTRGWIEFYAFNLTTLTRERSFLTDAGSCATMLPAPDGASIIVTGRWALAGDLFGRFSTQDFSTQWRGNTVYGNLRLWEAGDWLVGESAGRLNLIDPATGAVAAWASIQGLETSAISPDNRFVVVDVSGGPMQVYGILP